MHDVVQRLTIDDVRWLLSAVLKVIIMHARMHVWRPDTVACMKLGNLPLLRYSYILGRDRHLRQTITNAISLISNSVGRQSRISPFPLRRTPTCR